MLLALAFLIGGILFGVGLVRRIAPLRSRLNHAEQLMWGLVTGWIVTTLGAYLLARFMGRLSFQALAIYTLATWLMALWLCLPSFKRIRSINSFSKLWRAEYGWLALTLALFTPVFVVLFLTHMMKPGDGGVYTGGSTFFDIGFHLAVTTSFLYGENFPPLYTAFPPAELLYPFLPDFQISVLAALGMSLRAALLVTAIPLAIVITGLLYSFARRLLELAPERSQLEVLSGPIAAVLATILFLLNGGLGFTYFLDDWRESGKPLSVFWSTLEQNYANLGGRNIQWTNFIVDTMLPQRTSLFGYAAALLVLTIFIMVWRDWSLDEKKDRLSGVTLLVAAGTFTGLLPLFHAHVYLGLGLISGFLFLLSPRREWLAFWLPAVLLALPHLLDVFGHISGNGFMRFQFGWRGHNEPFWPWYWLRNVGLPALLIFPAWFAAPPVLRKFYVAFVLLLLVTLLVIISPNNYDNIKLMYLWYIPTTVLIARWLVRLAVVGRQRLIATVFTLICIASGLLALQSEGLSRQLLYSNEEISAAAFVRDHTSPRALFLTAPTVHQPILSLAGRPVLRGDTAWLWSHGYEFADREADVKAIYSGNADARELISYYGINYVYLGPRERSDRANQEFFEQNFRRVYQSPAIAIYDVGANSIAQLPAKVVPREFSARVDKDPYQWLVEFPRIAYVVYRYYQTAFGRAPRYAEFHEDLTIVGRELYVGREGWEQMLERNKTTLIENWQARADFKAAYEAKSNAEYVAALLSNLKWNARDAARRELIAALDRGESRASLLRRVAEGSPFERADYNTAYVLVHYFAYLRRNPDDAPDHNWAGFDFWRDDLNRTGDYRSVTRVFIEAGEYKDQ